VSSTHLGERENKQLNVVETRPRNVTSTKREWIGIKDAVGDSDESSCCLHEVYRRGSSSRGSFIGENIIHLPTVKTHVFTTTTGAMKNAFGAC